MIEKDLYSVGLLCSAYRFEDGLNCPKKTWQVIYAKTCSVLGETVVNKFPKLPPFTIAHNTVHRDIWSIVDFLGCYEFCEALPPALFKIVLLRFNQYYEGVPTVSMPSSERVEIK